MAVGCIPLLCTIDFDSIWHKSDWLVENNLTHLQIDNELGNWGKWQKPMISENVL